MGDIPSEGSGLGSSSTVTVGALNALYTYLGEIVSAEKLAREACSIEIDTGLKSPSVSRINTLQPMAISGSWIFCRDGEVKD
jgi:D-glycero-alpha-D-manno-heptose-7-phosphate kinase